MTSNDNSDGARAQYGAAPDVRAPWLLRRRDVMTIVYERGLSVIDLPTGRRLAWHEPRLELPELAELAALFSNPLDDWFAPRVHGLVMEAGHSILAGRVTPREMHKALGQVLGRPERAGEIFSGNPVLARTLMLQAIHTGTPIDKRALVKARKAFKVGPGRKWDETATFFLQEVKQLATDYGLDLRLPQTSDGRADDTTPFLTFAQIMIDIVTARISEIEPNPPPDVIRRMKSLRRKRAALIAALRRAKNAR